MLVLSEFAGAAAEMGEALLINPFDEERTASSVERALTFDQRERRLRMMALHSRVLRNNVFGWGDRFLTALREAVSARGRYADTQPKRLQPAAIHDAYLKSSRRLLMVDYDGTLVRFADQPQQGAPPHVVVRVLSALASDPRNVVALTSGRKAEDLDQWFGAVAR